MSNINKSLLLKLKEKNIVLDVDKYSKQIPQVTEK